MTILNADQKQSLAQWVVNTIAQEENAIPEVKIVPSDATIRKYFITAGRRKVIFYISSQGALVVGHDSRKDSSLKSARAA